MKNFILFFVVFLATFMLIGTASAETIHPFISHLSEGSFENWTNGLPNDWYMPRAGTSGIGMSDDSMVGNHSVVISGNSNNPTQGYLWTALGDNDNITRVGAWVKITGLTHGYLVFDL